MIYYFGMNSKPKYDGNIMIRNENMKLIKECPVYDLTTLARYNLHVHTIYSPCAKPEMTMENIIRCAEHHGIEVIAVTDHFNSENYAVIGHNKKLKEEVERLNTRIKVLFGAELSAYGVDKYLDSMEINESLDYRLYSYNHFHLDWWEQPVDKSPRGYVKHQIKVLTGLLKSGRADCIAHPFIGRFIRCIDDTTAVTSEITDNELGNIMELGKKYDVAWEINSGAMMGDTEFAKRYWNIGKEIGVQFNFGTDAHRLMGLDTMAIIEELKLILA